MDRNKPYNQGRHGKDGYRDNRNDRGDKEGGDRKYDNKKPYKNYNDQHGQSDANNQERERNHKYKDQPYRFRQDDKMEEINERFDKQSIDNSQSDKYSNQGYGYKGRKNYDQREEKPYYNFRRQNDQDQQSDFKSSDQQPINEMRDPSQMEIEDEKGDQSIQDSEHRRKRSTDRRKDNFGYKDKKYYDSGKERFNKYNKEMDNPDQQPREYYKGRKNFMDNNKNEEGIQFKTKQNKYQNDSQESSYRQDSKSGNQKQKQKLQMDEESILKRQMDKQQFFQDLLQVNDFCKTYFAFALMRENDSSWLHVNFTELLQKDQLHLINIQMKKTLQFLAVYVKEHITLPRVSYEFNNYEQIHVNKIGIFIKNIVEFKKKIDELVNFKVNEIKNNSQIDLEDELDNELSQFENKFELNESQRSNQMDDQRSQEDLSNFIQGLRNANQDQNEEEVEIQVVQQQQQDNDEDSSSDQEESDLEILNQMKEQNIQLTQEQGQFLSKFYVSVLKKFVIALKMERAMLLRNLPAYEIKQSLQQQIESSKNPFTLLIGTTGSGKTTQVPQFLIQTQILTLNYYKKIYCVQPKKINCLSISERVAQEMNCKLGEEVGYIVGYQKHEQQINPSKTRIIFITQSMFLSLLVARIKLQMSNNQTLSTCSLFSKVSHILLDEVHERMVEADIIMGLLKSSFSLGSQLKIILSSATVNTESFLNFFKIDNHPMQLCKIPGKLYEIEEVFCSNIYGTSVKKVVKILKHVITKVQEGDPLHQGHILIFLTDIQEIEECITECRKLTCIDFRKYALLSLHHKSERDDQNKVFQDLVNPYTKETIVKIIFATNIAESAITINNVTIVIDSGKEKCLVYNPIKNISNIIEQNISKSSSIQRQGRAGRTCPGICYKLYSENEYEAFLGDSIPEIKRVNIDFPVLKLLECGVKDIQSFPFFENPGATVLQNSLQNLKRLGGISLDEQVTQLGKIIQFTELEPFQVRCIIEGAQRGVLDQVLNILAVMSETNSLFKRAEKDQRRYQTRCQLERDIIEYKNEYKSDFLFYNFLFNKILTSIQADKSYIDKNNIKAPVFTNMYLQKQYLSQVIKKVKGYFPAEFTEDKNLTLENEDSRIQKSIFCNFFNQISIFTGSNLIGFSNIYSDITFLIHPYSKFAKEHFEESDLLFYGKLESKDTLNFAKHVSIFKKEWLTDERIVPGYLRDEIQQVLSRKLNPKCILNIEVSRYILLVFMKKFQESIHNQFKIINEANPLARIYMIIDENSCSIKFLGSEEGEKVFKEKKVEEEIMKLINQERNLQKKNIFIQKYKETSNYAVFGQGYEILDILLPHEFVRVRVFNFPRNIRGQRITNTIIEEFFGLQLNPNYSSVQVQQNERSNNVIITFTTYEAANQFVYQANLQMPEQYKDTFVQGLPESRALQKQDKVCLIAEWPIWKSKGQGQIIFGNQEDRDSTYNNLYNRQINRSYIKAFKYDPPMKPNQKSKSFMINLGSLSELTCEQDFRPFIVNLYQGFENVIIRREPIFWNEKEKLENMQKYTTELKTMISKVANEADREQVQINYDFGKKGCIKAKIQFPKEIQAEQFLQTENNRQFGQGRLHLQIQNQCKLSLKIRAFETIKLQFDEIVKKYKDNAQFDTRFADYEVLITLTTYAAEQRNVLVNDTQQNQNIFQLISQQLKNLIKPYILNFDVDPRDFSVQYEQLSKTFEQVQRELKIFLLPTPKKAEVSVWFHYTDEAVKQDTIKQLNSIFSSLIKSQKILKKKYFNQKILLEKLTELNKQTIISSIEDKQEFYIIKGAKSQLQRALIQINQECKFKKSEEYCKICYEDKSIERIDQCGCSYCQDCLLQHVLSSAVQSKFISCPDHNDVPIHLEDIKDIIPQTDEEKLIQDKINLQIDIWKNKKVNRQKFIRCASVNCDSFFGRKYYDKNDNEIDVDMPSQLKCPECYYSYCLKDTTKETMKLHDYHSFGRCDTLSDQLVIEQLKQLNAKQCPACKEMIIKNMGCNHMTCKCGAHFCYECLFYPNPSVAQSVYAHMSSVGH